MPTNPSFLADESCDFAIVRALRAVGFTVDAVCELAASSSDEAVIALAASRGQILLTEDKDFGELVFVANQRSGGVILVRFPNHERVGIGAQVAKVVMRECDRLPGSFTVIHPRRVRFSKLPS